MASDRFAKFSKADVKSFDPKFFTKFLARQEELGKREEIPAGEQQGFAMTFVLVVVVVVVVFFFFFAPYKKKAIPRWLENMIFFSIFYHSK